MCLWSVACRVRREGPARESRLGESNGVLNIMMPRYTRTYGNEMIGKIINSKWAGARSASRSKMRGACPDSGGGLATGEGAHPKRADRCRTARFITEMSVISNREWRAKKFRAEGGSLNWERRRRVTCHPLRGPIRASLQPRITIFSRLLSSDP